MSKLYDYWESQSSFYDGKLNGNVSLDDLSFTGKVLFNKKKTNLATKLKFTKSEDKTNPYLSSLSDVTLSHAFPFMKFSITQAQNKTTVNTDSVILNKGKHSISLLSKLRFDVNEKLSALPISSYIRYHYDKHTMFSVGVEDVDVLKEKYDGLVKAYALRGKKLDNGIKIYGGVCSGYQLKDKINQFVSFALSLKNKTINALMNFGLNRKENLPLNDASEGEQKCKCSLEKYEKVISVKADNKMTKKLTLGGDTEFNITNNEVKSRFFAMFDVDPSTKVKAKWEDKDKSVTMTLIHNFRGLLNMAVSGKVYGVKKENYSLPACLPAFKTKFGVALEVNETLI